MRPVRASARAGARAGAMGLGRGQGRLGLRLRAPPTRARAAGVGTEGVPGRHTHTHTPAAAALPASHHHRVQQVAAPQEAAALADGGWPWAAARGRRLEDQRSRRVAPRTVQGSSTQGGRRPSLSAPSWTRAAAKFERGKTRNDPQLPFFSPCIQMATVRLTRRGSSLLTSHSATLMWTVPN